MAAAKIVRLGAFVSATLGHIVLAITFISYISQLVTQPSQDVVAQALVAVGILGLLSGLCFAFGQRIPDNNSKWPPNYAAEKFLHACILLVQTALLKYSEQVITNWAPVAAVGWLHVGLVAAFRILVLIPAAFAAYATVYGFEAINDQLWSRWVGRRENIEKKG